MAVDTPAKIAIIGAGPTGLEAALYARYLGYEVEVFDLATSIECSRSWSNRKMWTPLAENSTSLGRAAISAHQMDEVSLPLFETLTYGQWYEHYVKPLAETDLVVDCLRLGQRVESVGKVELYRTSVPPHDRSDEEYNRGAWDFRLLVRNQDGNERIVAADVVFDCSGRLPMPIGHGGLPAIGETRLQSPRFTYGFADTNSISGDVLVVGDDISAAATIVQLSTSPARIFWATPRERRDDSDIPFNFQSYRTMHDSVCRLAAEESELLRETLNAANQFAQSDRVNWMPGSWVEAVRTVENDRIEIEFSGENEMTQVFDHVVACTGYRPDWSFVTELQFTMSPAIDIPHWDLKQQPELNEDLSADAMGLFTSEPNFDVLGSKRDGRMPSCSHTRSLKQIRDVFTIIGDRPTLDLYAKHAEKP